MIFGEEIFKILRESDDYNTAIFHYVIDDGIVDESTGRFDGADKKGKRIGLMYGMTDSHTNVIRIKSGTNSNFKNKNDFSEIFFKYNSKEYDIKGSRKLPSNERDFVLGFASRYEEPLNSNARKELPTNILTSLIDDDMNKFKTGKGNRTRYSVPTGKVDLVWNNGVPSFVESDDGPSNYTLSK